MKKKAPKPPVVSITASRQAEDFLTRTAAANAKHPVDADFPPYGLSEAERHAFRRFTEPQGKESVAEALGRAQRLALGLFCKHNLELRPVQEQIEYIRRDMTFLRADWEKRGEDILRLRTEVRELQALLSDAHFAVRKMRLAEETGRELAHARTANQATSMSLPCQANPHPDPDPDPRSNRFNQ